MNTMPISPDNQNKGLKIPAAACMLAVSIPVARALFKRMGTCLAAITMLGASGLTVNASLVVSQDSGFGVTNEPPVSRWDDQSSVGGFQNFSASASTAKPALATGVTPTGQKALVFNGAASNPNQMTFGPTSLFDAAPSLTFMMVLKPTPGATTDWYLQSKISNAPNTFGWGLSYNAGNFSAQARSTSTPFNSSIAGNSLGSLQDDWMILSGVYDNATFSLQLFLTDAAGSLHTSGTTTVTGGLANGTHQLTSIGADINRANGATADIAAVRIWDEALSASARVAAEQSLYEVYIVPEPKSSLLLLLGAGALMARWWIKRGRRATPYQRPPDWPGNTPDNAVRSFRF